MLITHLGKDDSRARCQPHRNRKPSRHRQTTPKKPNVVLMSFCCCGRPVHNFRQCEEYLIFLCCPLRGQWLTSRSWRSSPSSTLYRAIAIRTGRNLIKIGRRLDKMANPSPTANHGLNRRPGERNPPTLEPHPISPVDAISRTRKPEHLDTILPIPNIVAGSLGTVACSGASSCTRGWCSYSSGKGFAAV